MFLISSSYVTSKCNPETQFMGKWKETEAHLLKRTSLAANTIIIMSLFIFKLILCNPSQSWRFCLIYIFFEKRRPPKSSKQWLILVGKPMFWETPKSPKDIQNCWKLPCTNSPSNFPSFFPRCCGLSGTWPSGATFGVESQDALILTQTFSMTCVLCSQSW